MSVTCKLFVKMWSVTRPQECKSRYLSFRRQRGIAAGEDQTEAIIFDLLVIVIEGSFVDTPFVDAHFQFDVIMVERKISLCSVEARAPADPVDGLEACR